ncbi:MAG: cell division protein FtsB [Alcanivoracaceae bacterium]|nr:cell division protein FtsB [Alcanivoracaceae bacterium]
MKVVNGILLFLLVVMLWAHWFGVGGAKELKEKQLLYELQLKKNKKLQQRNEKLKAEVADLKQGLEAVEERARSEMGMIKPGETFIQVIEDDNVN